MTLGKYIQRLTDRLDPVKQFDRKKAAENARKARTNTQPEFPVYMRPKLIRAQYRRYGFVHWLTRRKRGQKDAQGYMLPRTQQ